jgi:DNA polymerase III subunit gamma/tau
LTRLQPDILNFLQQKLQNSSIRMQLILAEENEMQRASSPEDRYKIMAQQNPALDKLRNALGLEID